VRLSAHDDSNRTPGSESQDQVREQVRHGAEEPDVFAHAYYLGAIDVDRPPKKAANAEPSFGQRNYRVPLDARQGRSVRPAIEARLWSELNGLAYPLQFGGEAIPSRGAGAPQRNKGAKDDDHGRSDVQRQLRDLEGQHGSTIPPRDRSTAETRAKPAILEGHVATLRELKRGGDPRGLPAARAFCTARRVGG